MQDDDDLPPLYDPTLLLKLWCSGPLSLCMAHRLYLRTWRGAPLFFLLRLLTCNYAALGWVADGIMLTDLNNAASKVPL
jgi:hypothetical protein